MNNWTRTVVGVAAATVALTCVPAHADAAPAFVKHDDTPGCVSHAEWDSIKPVDVRHFLPVLWTRREVNQHFGAIPFDVQESPFRNQGVLGDVGTYRVQTYRPCWKRFNGEVQVDFVKSDVDPFTERFRSVDGIAF